MKKIIYTLFIALGLFACQNSQENESNKEQEAVKVEESKSYAAYGEEINSDGIVSYEEFASMLNENDTVAVKLSGEIDKTCKVKGCWMKVNVEGEENPMHITFKDYGFFVPKEGMENKAAIFEGIAFVDTISVEMLQHYAEDEGLSEEEIAAIIEPEVVVTFEASGVLIEDSRK